MTAFADLLDPGDRDRLAALADPRPHPVDLAAAARDAAAGSSGQGRAAWFVVALAIACTDGTPDAARDLADAIVHDAGLRTLARACLATLYSDRTTTETP